MHDIVNENRGGLQEWLPVSHSTRRAPPSLNCVGDTYNIVILVTDDHIVCVFACWHLFLTFVAHSGHFRCVRKLNGTGAFTLEYQGLTWLILTHVVCERWDLATPGDYVYILKKTYIIVFDAKSNIHRPI